MSYGIIRVRNLHMCDLQKTHQHNERKYVDEKLDLPNIDESKTHLNISDYTGANLYDAVNEKLKDVKIRRDSVVALEYVCTLSPEVMTELDKTTSIQAVLSDLKLFIINKHGEDNMVNVSYHFDESNPHIHAIVVPIVEKEVKWKNRNGEGVKIEKRLCARDYTGNKELLRQLQTDFHNFITCDSTYLGSKLNSKGIELKRGVDARERRAGGKYYSRMTNYIIAEHLKRLEELNEDVKLNRISKEQYQEKSKEVNNIINDISNNMEKKKEKDLQKYKDGRKNFDINF